MRKWVNKVNLSSFSTQNVFQIRACVISTRKAFNFHQYIAFRVPTLSHFYSRKFFVRVSFFFFFAFNYLFIHLLVLFTDLVDIKTIEQEVTYKVKPPTPPPPPPPPHNKEKNYLAIPLP